MKILEPYLHHDVDRIYNPLTQAAIGPHDADFAVLAALARGGTAETLGRDARERLAAAGWLIEPGPDRDRRFRLRYVSLEAHTICNQACYFCPVSIDPRDEVFMPTETFNRLVGELGAFRETIEGVFLMSYNEPTVDRRFVDQCRTIIAADLPCAVNSNGSALTPKKIDALLEAGPIRFLSINISTIDPDAYQVDRQATHLDAVIRNLDYAAERRVAEEMVLVVLGEGDRKHDEAVAAISERWGDSQFEIQSHRLMDRAGYLAVGAAPEPSNRPLAGCENLGSRPLEHLHITPRAQAVLCCEDYDEKWVIGDLQESTIREVLEGDVVARLRRQAYGLEESADDFICNRCLYARRRPPTTNG